MLEGFLVSSYVCTLSLDFSLVNYKIDRFSHVFVLIRFDFAWLPPLHSVHERRRAFLNSERMKRKKRHRTKL